MKKNKNKNKDNQKYNLKEIQKVELEILIKFDKICRENNLTYSLDGGTALGAVRHGGFIPWDDDIDVNMPRDDYDVFMAIGQEQLGDKYFLQNRATDPNSPFTFAKIRKNGTTFLEWNKRNIKMHHGIFIDIFPFDVIPRELKGRKKYVERCFKLNDMLIKRVTPDRSSHNDGSIKWILGAIIRRIIYYILHIIPKTIIEYVIDKEFTKYKDLGLEGNDCISHSYAMQTIFPSEVLYPPREILFEGHNFYAPADCERYLTMVYGDYMKVPPEEERVGHRPKIISLEKEIFERY